MFTLIGILGRVSADISEDVIVILEASIVLIYVQLIYVYRVIFSLLPSRKRCIFSFPLHVQNRTGWVAAPLTLDNDLAEPVTPDSRDETKDRYHHLRSYATCCSRSPFFVDLVLGRTL